MSCVLIDDVTMWMMYHSVMGNTWVERIEMKRREILQQPLLLKHFGSVVEVSYSNDNSPVVAFPVFYTVCLEESLFCSLLAFPQICSLSLFPVSQQFALSPRALSFSWGGICAHKAAKEHPNLKVPLLVKGGWGEPEWAGRKERTCHLLEESLLT